MDYDTNDGVLAIVGLNWTRIGRYYIVGRPIWSLVWTGMTS